MLHQRSEKTENKKKKNPAPKRQLLFVSVLYLWPKQSHSGFFDSQLFIKFAETKRFLGLGETVTGLREPSRSTCL
jgi:hypothetical protein